MSLTVAIPTIGRPTLARTVFSLIDQLHDGDEVILVADPKGDPEYARFVYEIGSNRIGVNWIFDIHDDPESGWGQAQRNRAYDLADPGNHVWCLADDDIATPWAVGVAHTVADAGHWAIMRVGRGTREPWMWAVRDDIRPGNLDADCIIAPASVEARWGLDYEGDATFAARLAFELGEPAWLSQVIAVTKPSKDYLWTSFYPDAASEDIRSWHGAHRQDCVAYSEGQTCCVDRYFHLF